ncbi:MFS transporter [Mesorhizobium sp.]|uniref:MFS transporter n=1 Tax=Mesorhizobium sp. TaxID=1871066 RepID=UPI0025C594DF|nr:MFS transporter [Mesorhizobium sp.]
MFAGWCLIAFASAMLAALVTLGLVDPWIVLAVGFLAGCGMAFTDPAWHASVGDVLSKRDVPAAVTLISVGYNAIRSVGPALGGIIVASFGPLTAFAMATLGYVALLWTVRRGSWKVRSSLLPREPMSTEIHDGVRFTACLRKSRQQSRAELSLWPGEHLHARVAPSGCSRSVGGGPIAYGTLMAGFGTGAFFAGLCNNFLRRIISQERLITLSCLVCAACCLSLALTSSLPLAVMVLALGGAAWVITWTGLDVSVQLSSPRWVGGRTLSIYDALSYGGIAAGSWVWGMVAQDYSLPLALEGSAVALLLVAATGLLLLSANGRSLTRSFGIQRAGACPRSEAAKRAHCVKIEYSIPEKKVEVFL